MALVDPSLGPCRSLETSGAHARAVRSPLMLSDSVAGNENPPSEARSRSPLKRLNVFPDSDFFVDFVKKFYANRASKSAFYKKELVSCFIRDFMDKHHVNKTFRQQVN